MLGIEPTAIRQCVPSTVRPSASVTTTPSPSRRTALARDFDMTVMPRRRKTSSSTVAASASSPGSTRSRLETSVTSEPSDGVRRGELRAGDAGADHDELLRQLLEGVDLLPGEDPLAVRLRVGQHPRMRAGGHQDRVGVERLLPRAGRGDDPGRPVEPARAADDPHPLGVQAGGDVVGLGAGERRDPGVDPRRSTPTGPRASCRARHRRRPPGRRARRTRRCRS